MNKVIYKENEYGQIKYSELENFMRIAGVWALYGRDKETNKCMCLNVGKSIDVGNEILYDIGCLHFLKIRNDGSKSYINQFGEDCNFMYNSGQTQEYLYPEIASKYDSFKFIYIHDKPDEKVEKKFAVDNHAIYWRNGSPYGVKKKNNLTSNRMLVIGNLFPNGGELYSHTELLRAIESNLGYSKRQSEKLINDCLKAGFLISTSDKMYTR